MDYLEGLNSKQKEAVEYIEGPMLILAGAGSGKTKTMIHRMAHMIEKGISPYHILAVTFTNKAAKEMRDRLSDLIGQDYTMWILTFHGACMRILRSHIHLLGYSSDFSIYDGADQKTVIKECLKAANMDDKEYPVPYIQKIIGDCKDRGISAAENELTCQVGSKSHKAAQIYKRYENVLIKNNALDFDDLILKTVRIFEENKDVLEYYQEKFKYIMVDEYQDTNYMQYKLIKLLGQKYSNVCVVGDDDQCIYEWRGANIQNILGFEKDFKNVKVIKLEQNYRSTSTILSAAHSVIKNNCQRKEKRLWTDQEKGEKITCHQCMNEKDEGLFIAKAISRLKGLELKYSDFAILYRTHAQSRAIEDALRLYEIPYAVFGGLKFYDRKEIKDVGAYLKLIQNPADELSIKRVINEPKRGIGAKTLEKLQLLAEERGETLFSVLMDEDVQNSLSQKIKKGIGEFVNVILKYHNEKDQMTVSEIYEGFFMSLYGAPLQILDIKNKDIQRSFGRYPRV
jgi:DNA helicase-2/ATP-dependent DNA helicase PcrA